MITTKPHSRDTRSQEVCHRGFGGLATALVQAGADVSHVPSEYASTGAHIMRGAPQSALGEAARGGFKSVRENKAKGAWVVCEARIVRVRWL